LHGRRGATVFKTGHLVGLRAPLIEHHLDRRLVERTVEPTAGTKRFGAEHCGAGLLPLWGAGLVKDTFGLMGHALRKARRDCGAVGAEQTAETAVVPAQGAAPELADSSLKAALDRDWDDPADRDGALAVVLGRLKPRRRPSPA
jgi:transposase